MRPSTLRHFAFSALLPMLALPAPRGDGGVPEDSDKELQKLKTLLDRKDGDSQSLAAELLAENSKLRKERHGLREELKTASDKAPAQGTVVLSGEEVAKWNALKEAGEGAVVLPKSKAALLADYEQLGAPDALKTQLESGQAAFTKNAARERADNLETASKFKMSVDGQDATFKPSLLKAVAKDWDVVTREVEVTDAEGKVTKEQRPFVVAKKEGEADQFTPLAERVKAEGEDVYRDMLTFSDGETTATKVNNGIEFPSQGGGQRVNDTAMLDNFSTNRYGHVLPQKAS